MSAITTTAQLPARPLRRRRPGRGTLAALALLAAIALALGFFTGGAAHNSSRAHARASSYAAGDRSFSVSVPAGWHASAVGRTAAVIERADHGGVVLVREHPRLRHPLSSLVKGLPRELAKRFPDFKPVGASVARLSTGPAVVYTFVRTRSDKVQSIVVAPAARHSFTIEVVASGKARGAAHEAGQIVRSLRAR